MPKLSDTMTVGTLVKWLKDEGDTVANGDMIAEVETDKATMEVECFDDGILLKQYCAAGDEVEVGGAIAAVGEEGEEAPDAGASTPKPSTDTEDADDSGDADQEEPEESDAGTDEAEDAEAEKDEEQSEEKPKAEDRPPEEPSEKSSEVTGGQTAGQTTTTAEGGRIKASPLAKKVAADKGINLADIQGTGPGGRIVKADVEGFKPDAAPAKEAKSTVAKEPPAEAPAATLEALELPVSNMRKSIAKALVASKTQAPHFYLQIEVDGAPLAKLRAELNAKLADLPKEHGGTKFTVNDLTLKAAAEAVRRVPAINRSWEGDKIAQHANVHLAFGVAIDDGLVTPVIRAAETKGLREIGAEAKVLIKKARDKKLAPDEMSGSTLTVTNLGMFGISDFYGIINPNNAAILSIGATIKKPVVNKNDEIVIGQVMKIGLSGDHRTIDGAVGAQYLQALKEIIETPALMLV
jgi:pyruvate dehydrogenase E2 component (dihydrolipoamide acetyltransferase)